ncbi:hypothetical protein BHU72_14855 [Desulfuribacillus stibiiarsenatis]|uniref:HTH cro/C1-type domain-containing protein n=1 Tax=Desulfuribacillus stibiiarsenatis TaxID=1390249 RepID=A0A1E5L7A1_9FIRM|nr:helix-turn-helix domain-containing protein [Desulfuribacillus stibiiarsenatis]OEH86030.1 hypothetical protein BHU72_14855 [Desulfuribacillus stibiiarsenatis]
MKCNLIVILAERKRDKLPNSRQWLADQVGITRQQLGNILNGEDTRLSVAKAISKAVDRKIEHIWPE